MNAGLIARLTLARANPEYARQRLKALIEAFMQDVAERPEVYRATIPAAALQDQPTLHRMLNMIVEIVQAHNASDIQRLDELEAEYHPLQPAFENRMQKVWTDLYFVGDIWKETNLCLSIVQQSGIPDQEIFRGTLA
jgi:hypothetical protein